MDWKYGEECCSCIEEDEGRQVVASEIFSAFQDLMPIFIELQHYKFIIIEIETETTSTNQNQYHNYKNN